MGKKKEIRITYEHKYSPSDKSYTDDKPLHDVIDYIIERMKKSEHTKKNAKSEST